VGRVLSLLDQLAKRDNTIVVFSSDNGPEVTHPNPGDKFFYSVGSTGGLRGRKRSLYLGGVGTPLIVRWPGHVPAGRVDKRSVLSGVDFFPTLLAAAGLSLPDGYQPDGENVLSALRGGPFQRTKPIFWQWRGNHSQAANWPVRGMRDRQWTLLTDDGSNRVELFQVFQNRQQDRDVSDQHADRVKSMLAKIKTWEATLPDDPPVVTQQAARPAIDRNAIFDRKDSNGDEMLTLEEYLDRFPDQAEGRRRFPGFDKDGDGQLSREEFVRPN
jgi:N-acetylgalactosamine-6-sulfatase